MDTRAAGRCSRFFHRVLERKRATAFWSQGQTSGWIKIHCSHVIGGLTTRRRWRSEVLESWSPRMPLHSQKRSTSIAQLLTCYNWTEVKWTDQNRTELIRTELKWTELDRTEQTEPNQTEQIRIGLDLTEPNQTKPNRSEPNWNEQN